MSYQIASYIPLDWTSLQKQYEDKNYFFARQKEMQGLLKAPLYGHTNTLAVLFPLTVTAAIAAPVVCLTMMNITVYSAATSLLVFGICCIASKRFYKLLVVPIRDIEDISRLCIGISQYMQRGSWKCAIHFLEGFKACPLSYIDVNWTGMDDFPLKITGDFNSYKARVLGSSEKNKSSSLKMNSGFHETFESRTKADRWYCLAQGTAYLNHAVNLYNKNDITEAMQAAGRAEFWLSQTHADGKLSQEEQAIVQKIQT